MESSSSISRATTAASAGRPPCCAPAALSATAPPCQRWQIRRSLHPNRGLSGQSRQKRPWAQPRDYPVSPRLTVWYNTRCPICNGGIDWQRNRLARAARDRIIEFRDINLEPDALSQYRKTLADVRRRLHGVDDEGNLYVGADCAIEIWRRTPGDAWLGRLLSLPLVRPAARFVYDRFADALYAWNRRKGHF